MKITKFKTVYKKYFPVGEGWRKLVTKLVEDIIKIDSTVEISQIKEKFGTLRFYIDYGNNEIFNLIEKAEIESGKTCESCGTKNNVTTEGGWVLTLCHKCRKERTNKWKLIKLNLIKNN